MRWMMAAVAVLAAGEAVADETLFPRARLVEGSYHATPQPVVAFLETLQKLELDGAFAPGAGTEPRDDLGGLSAKAWVLDLVPDLPEAEVARRMSRPRGKASRANHLRKVLGLTGVRAGLLRELAPEAVDPPAMAAAIKALPLPVLRPRPIAEAISSAGGVAWAGIDGDLMLRALPGVFAAGEMLDWEAPTGGYLLTACLATGRWAGRHAAAWARTPA